MPTSYHSVAGATENADHFGRIITEENKSPLTEQPYHYREIAP
jgi:hypothetical protein